MSIFRSYLKLFSVTVLASVLLLRWYAMQFLYRTPEKYWAGLPTTLIATLAIAIIVAALVYKVTRPFDVLINKIQHGHIPDNEEKKRALSVYKKVNAITLGANIIGFFVGQIIVLVIEVSQGVTEYNISRIVFSVVQSVLIGSMSAIYTIFILNEMLVPHRQLLQIRAVDNFFENRNLKTGTTILLISAVSLLYMWCNTLSVSYELINVQNTRPVANAMSIYIKSGILVGIVSLLPSMVILYIVVRGLGKRIENTAELVQNIGKKGDLNSRLNITVLDDFGNLIGDINNFMNQFYILISNLQKEANVVSNSATVLGNVSESATTALQQMTNSLDEIKHEGVAQEQLIIETNKDITGLTENVQEVEQHIHSQYFALEQTSAAMNQIATNINSVAGLTKQADELSASLAKTSTNGRDTITAAVDSIEKIQEASVQVQKIVGVIQKIAAQTNLLSMNAAIEAAHAGESGKGFAIVANEVRSLAKSSADSTREIQNYIKMMVEKINIGSALINDAGKAFYQITENVNHSASLVKTIAESMSSQQLGANETIQATASLVETMGSIKDLSNKQSGFAKNVKAAMQSVVVSSEKVADLLLQNTKVSANLKEAIEEVDTVISKNSEAVSIMQKHIKIFNVV